jgi:hypothetical protein
MVLFFGGSRVSVLTSNRSWTEWYGGNQNFGRWYTRASNFFSGTQVTTNFFNGMYVNDSPMEELFLSLLLFQIKAKLLLLLLFQLC